MIESNTHIYEFGDFRLDAAKRLLLKDTREIVPLMPKAFDTLLYLVRCQHRSADCFQECVSHFFSSLFFRISTETFCSVLMSVIIANRSSENG